MRAPYPKREGACATSPVAASMFRVVPHGQLMRTRKLPKAIVEFLYECE